MADKSYWENRMIQLFNAQDKQIAKLDKKLQKEYQRLVESINKEIASYYARYGKDDVIEYRNLVLGLSEAQRDLLYKDYQTFAKKYPQYLHLMPIRESIYQLNRLEGLQMNIRMQLLELGALEQEEFEKLLKEAYENGYLSTMKGLDNAPSFFSVNNITLQQTLNERWINGANFSDRIWGNKERLLNTLNNEIRDGIIRGDDYKQMAKIIQHRLGVGKYDSMRLVVTESAFVTNQANKQAFMDAGIERYEVSAVMDRRTSPTCRGLDGEHFEFKDAKVGVNYPPFHAFCRTTVIPIENGVVSLNEDEERAINQYISSDAYKINEKLRYSLPLDDNDRTLVMNLDNALTKMPLYEGDLTRSLFFHDSKGEENFLSKHGIDNLVEYNEYISTTKGARYNQNSQIEIYILNSKKGRDITKFNSEEAEILFERNSKFKVVGKELYKNIIYIFMEEYNE